MAISTNTNPIIICKGKRITTLAELQENFDISKVCAYAKGGRLSKWLISIGENAINEELQGIDFSLPEDMLAEDLMVLLGVAEEKRNAEFAVSNKYSAPKTSPKVQTVEENTKEKCWFCDGQGTKKYIFYKLHAGIFQWGESWHNNHNYDAPCHVCNGTGMAQLPGWLCNKTLHERFQCLLTDFYDCVTQARLEAITFCPGSSFLGDDRLEQALMICYSNNIFKKFNFQLVKYRDYWDGASNTYDMFVSIVKCYLKDALDEECICLKPEYIDIYRSFWDAKNKPLLYYIEEK